MAQIEIPLGSTARAIFETLAAENGARVAPDSAPTVTGTWVNGTATTLSSAPAVAQLQNTVPANITGAYQVSFPTGSPNSLSVGDVVWVEVSATINGNTAPKKTFSFLVVPAAVATTPVIR
jgi:hypothetical protein